MKKISIIPYKIKKIKKEEEKKKAIVEKYIKNHYKNVKNVKEIMELPKENEIYHCITMNAFNAFTFIPFILEKEIIEKMIVSTYAISLVVIKSIEKFMKKEKIKECFILISDVIVKRKQYIINQLKVEASKNKKFHWNYCKTHAKVTLIKTKDNYYVIEGSGNFNQNSQIEQYVIANNKKLYEFHKKWIDTEILQRG